MPKDIESVFLLLLLMLLKTVYLHHVPSYSKCCTITELIVIVWSLTRLKSLYSILLQFFSSRLCAALEVSDSVGPKSPIGGPRPWIFLPGLDKILWWCGSRRPDLTSERHESTLLSVLPRGTCSLPLLDDTKRKQQTQRAVYSWWPRFRRFDKTRQVTVQHWFRSCVEKTVAYERTTAKYNLSHIDCTKQVAPQTPRNTTQEFTLASKKWKVCWQRIYWLMNVYK